jgi:hypothetical protein
MQKYLIDVTIEDLSKQRRLLTIDAKDDKEAIRKAQNLAPDTIHALYQLIEIPLPKE